MVYGRYKQIRNAIWQILIDYKIDSMPILISRFTDMLGLKIMSYTQGKSILNDLNLIKNCENAEGFAVKYNKWFIFYDSDIKTRTRIRFTLAHELGHILLGHQLLVNKSGVVFTRGVKKGSNTIETEADMLAIRLLAPSCVLWGLGIHKPEDIARLCQISNLASQYKAERMKELYKRNMFLSHPLERQVYEQFKPFINNYKNNPLD